MAFEPRRPDRAAAIVLAAGRSTRMGAKNKLLLEIEPGVAMVRRVVERALSCGFDPIFVVTGHEADAVRRALSGMPCRFVDNPQFADGLAGSVKAGFGAAMGEGAAGAVVLLGDMPFVPAEAIGKILEVAAGDPLAIVQAVTDGKPAHPVWLPARLAGVVQTLEGDRGVRSLVTGAGETMTTVEVSADAAIDVDTPQEFEAAIAAGKPGSRN
ncbi:MAG: nucleotidyltransferase family protein [Oricola sp.]